MSEELTTTLEGHDGPLTRAFPSPSRDSARYRLPKDDLVAFERNGYLTGLDVLTEDQVLEARERLVRLQARLPTVAPFLYEVEAAWTGRPDEVVFHALGAWRVDTWFHDLIFHPKITVPLAQILGVSRLRFWHDQIFAKPPKHRGVVPWHQDYSYWTRSVPARHITINIVLDATDVENGCLHVVPESHKWPLLPPVRFDDPLDALLEHVPQELVPSFRPVALPLGAGQASIHHSHTIHGSDQNASDRPRRALVLNYMDADTRCADGTAPLLRGVPLIEEGALIEGAFFPIVWDESKFRTT